MMGTCCNAAMSPLGRRREKLKANKYGPPCSQLATVSDRQLNANSGS
jgi:hypothetical protein